jgi:methionyl aminopeptidase
LVSIDCGVLKNGYYGDAAYTFPLGNVTSENRALCDATLRSLYKGINASKCGMRMGDIGFAIQSFIENECGYSVVRELVGHGIGKELHEAPVVLNVGKRGSGQMIKSGLVIAIEPMVNAGKKEVVVLNDGWTVISKDMSASAHYEHTVGIFDEGVFILTDHSGIERVCLANPFLNLVIPEG